MRNEVQKVGGDHPEGDSLSRKAPALRITAVDVSKITAPDIELRKQGQDRLTAEIRPDWGEMQKDQDLGVGFVLQFFCRFQRHPQADDLTVHDLVVIHVTVGILNRAVHKPSPGAGDDKGLCPTGIVV